LTSAAADAAVVAAAAAMAVVADDPAIAAVIADAFADNAAIAGDPAVAAGAPLGSIPASLHRPTQPDRHQSTRHIRLSPSAAAYAAIAANADKERAATPSAPQSATSNAKPTRRCGHCGATSYTRDDGTTRKPNKCGNWATCRTFYCNQDCSTLAWKRHKLVCMAKGDKNKNKK
jgi:hypothetical protein